MDFSGCIQSECQPETPRPNVPGKRWSAVDLDQMLSQGRGDQSFIDAKFKCSVCGGKADKQLRPPVVPYKDSEQLF